MVYYGILPIIDCMLQSGYGWYGIRASVGIDEATTIAHEIGHNFDRKHVPCRGEPDPDRNYPYPNGLIGQWGTNVDEWGFVDPSRVYDFMSYCGEEWVSDYTYNGLFNDQVENGLVYAPMKRGQYFMISAQIGDQGEFELQPVYLIEREEPTLKQSSDYSVEALDSAGNILVHAEAEIYEAQEQDGETLRNLYAWIPYTGVPVASIRLVNAAGEIVSERILQNDINLAVPPSSDIPGEELNNLIEVLKEWPVMLRKIDSHTGEVETLAYQQSLESSLSDLDILTGQRTEIEIIPADVGSPQVVRYFVDGGSR
jgi:hypothetical protein